MIKSESNIWGVLPVKRTEHAKQRLSPALSPAQRQALALVMLQDVLDALTAARGLAGIVVVTEDAQAMTIARRLGCRIITEAADSGHTGAVTAAGRILRDEGQAGMLTIPGDVPLVTGQEIEAVLNFHGSAPAFSIVPAHDELGSNAILLTPPDALTLRFGDNSFFPHLDAARAAGLAPRVVKLPGLACDIDAPEDLERFMNMPGQTRTRAFLQEALALS